MNLRAYLISKKLDLLLKLDSNGLFDESIMTDNRILPVAIMYYVFTKLKLFNKCDEISFKRTINSLWARDLNGNVIKGLLTRQPVGYSRPDDNLNEIESVRHWDRDQHDNEFGASFDTSSAKYIGKYGFKHFAHYDIRTFKDIKKEYGFLKAIKEYIRFTRQPYQLAAHQLTGFGICSPIGYFHLLCVILLEFFKGYSSGKILLLLFSGNTRGLGKPLGSLFTFLMGIKYGKNYIQSILSNSFCKELPELIDLINNI